jgi:hypothetical protein
VQIYFQKHDVKKSIPSLGVSRRLSIRLQNKEKKIQETFQRDTEDTTKGQRRVKRFMMLLQSPFTQ